MTDLLAGIGEIVYESDEKFVESTNVWEFMQAMMSATPGNLKIQ